MTDNFAAWKSAYEEWVYSQDAPQDYCEEPDEPKYYDLWVDLYSGVSGELDDSLILVRVPRELSQEFDDADGLDKIRTAVKYGVGFSKYAHDLIDGTIEVPDVPVIKAVITKGENNG